MLAPLGPGTALPLASPPPLGGGGRSLGFGFCLGEVGVLGGEDGPDAAADADADADADAELEGAFFAPKAARVARLRFSVMSFSVT